MGGYLGLCRKKVNVHLFNCRGCGHKTKQTNLEVVQLHEGQRLILGGKTINSKKYMNCLYLRLAHSQ